MASVMTCRKCGTANAADSRYCDQCSAPLQVAPPVAGAADPGPTLTRDLRGVSVPVPAPHPTTSVPTAQGTGPSPPPDNLTTVPLDSASVAPRSASARVAGSPAMVAAVTTPIHITPTPLVAGHAPAKRNNSGFLVIGGVVLAVILFLGGLASLAGNVINVSPTATAAPTADLQATIAAILSARDATAAANLGATQTALPQGVAGDAGRATAQAQATVERATAAVLAAGNDLATQVAQSAAASATAKGAGDAANAAAAAAAATQTVAAGNAVAGATTATAGALAAVQQTTQAAQQAAQQATQQAAQQVAGAIGTAVAAATNAGQTDSHKTATSVALAARTAAAGQAAQQAVTRTALAALSGAQAATAGAAATKAAAQQATNAANAAAQQATTTAAQAAQQATAAALAAQASAQQATAAAVAAAQTAAAAAAQTATAVVPVAWAPRNVRLFAAAVPGCGAAPSSNFNYPQPVFVQVAMDDAPAGTRVDVIWSGGDKGYSHTDSQTPPSEVRPACFDGFSLDPSRAAIGPGTYQISLRVNGSTVKTITVQIAGPPAAPTSAVWVPRNVRAFTSATSGCEAGAQTTFNYPAVVYFQLALDDAPAGTKIEVLWSGGFNGYTHTDSQTNPNEIRPACYEGFSLDTSRARIGPGVYTLSVQINGTVVKTLQVTVNGPPPSATPLPAAPPAATVPHPTATTAAVPPAATPLPVAPSPTSGPARPPHLYEVDIRSTGFSPHEIGDAHVGDTVRFTNSTNQTQVTVVINTPAGPVENGVGKGDTWDYTFTAPGTYNYFNKFNGGQTGRVIVSP